MQSHVEKAIQELPSRARVELALASAEHTLASLADCPDVCGLASRGLADAWRWVNGTAVRPLDLYRQIAPLAFASTDLAPDTAPHNAALAVVSALYYAAGEAAAYEIPENAHPLFSPLGSDMADVGYEDLVECLERAASSACGSGEYVTQTAYPTSWERNLSWRKNVNDVVGAYFCDSSVMEGAAELVFVSEDHPDYHHLYLSTFNEAIKIALSGTENEKAELVVLLRHSNLAVATTEEAHGLLEEIRAEYLRQYHLALTKGNFSHEPAPNRRPEGPG